MKKMQMVVQMVQIGANGAHVTNGGENGANWYKWCTRRKWCKLVQMVHTVVQMFVQMVQLGAKDANCANGGANWCKWCTLCKFLQMVHTV